MAVNPIPETYPRVMPYLMTADAAATLDFMVRILDGNVVERIEKDGVVVHAEVRVADSLVMLAQANEQYPAVPTMLYAYVTDVDAGYRQALELGATSDKEPETQFYGDRSCMVTDGGGIQWSLATHVEDVTPEELARRAAEFQMESAS